MGNFIKAALIVGVLACLVTSCGQITGGGASIGTIFYDNVTSTTPVFKPSSVTGSAVKALDVRAQATDEWASGNPLYAVYFSMREFLPARDEGKVDRSNIYKLLTDVDYVYSSTSKEAQAITEQVITPPFSQLSGVLCDRATNEAWNKVGIALKETSAAINSVMGWIWTDSPLKNEYGVAVVSLETGSKDLNVEMVYSVDYNISNPETDYNLRCLVSGNAARNEFQFKYLVGDIGIVAKGISRGAGNYMLFKYSGFGSPVKYIVVPADADENFFIAQNSNPTNIYDDPATLPASVEAYKAWVVGTNFFTSAEVVSNINTFNSGNSRQGTIYINY